MKIIDINFVPFWAVDADKLAAYCRESGVRKHCLSASRAIKYDVREGNADLDRREFIAKTTAFAGAALAFGGCVSLSRGCSERVPYGDTIGDRLWMWGHGADALLTGQDNYGLEAERRMDMAPACEYMGIRNVCVIRWHGKPEPPFDDCARSLSGLKRVAWSITDGSAQTFSEKVDFAFSLSDRMPNLTTFYMDDYFCNNWKSRRPTSELVDLKSRMQEKGIELACVLYSDQNGFKKEYRPQLALCDEVSCWFWEGENITGMAERMKACRDFVPAESRLMLGLYMWDFGGRKPLPADLMKHQLDVAGDLIARGIVNGLIFHCTILCDLGLPAVETARKWIVRHGTDRI